MTQFNALTFCYYLGDSVVLAFVTTMVLRQLKQSFPRVQDVCLIVFPRFGGIAAITV